MPDETKPAKKQTIRWAAVLWYIHLHFLGLYGLWMVLTSAKWMTVFFTIFITSFGCLGVTVGAHRFWGHRTFETGMFLRLFLILAHTLAGVGPVYNWVLYHRLHHKYYGTDKDPYNHKKGFLYSHCTNHLVQPKVEYAQARIDIDMRDMDADTLVQAQKNFYWLFFGLFGLLLPLNAPLAYWNEALLQTILITGILRFLITLHVSWLVNSALLVWSRLDTKLSFDDLSIFIISRSYWPAYHYLVPWDWKIGEFGNYDRGFSSFIIKVWRDLGWIEGLRTTTTEDLRDVVHEIASKKFTLKEGIRKLQEISRDRVEVERKEVHH